MWRILAFVAIIASAALFDLHIENDFEQPTLETSANAQRTGDDDQFLIVTQSTLPGLKVSVQKFNVRKLNLSSQAKFIRKYHQHRNYQVLKAEVQPQTTPMILSYHYLAFSTYFFSLPDDEASLA